MMEPKKTNGALKIVASSKDLGLIVAMVEALEDKRR